jgi:hypothetical protein
VKMSVKPAKKMVVSMGSRNRKELTNRQDRRAERQRLGTVALRVSTS